MCTCGDIKRGSETPTGTTCVPEAFARAMREKLRLLTLRRPFVSVVSCMPSIFVAFKE